MEPAGDRLMGAEERAGGGRRRGTPAGGHRDGPSGHMATGASAGAQAPSRFITGGATRRRTTTEPGPPKGGSTACLGLSPPESQGRGASAVRPTTGSRGAGAAVARRRAARVGSLANPQPVHKRARNRARNCLPDDPQAGYEPFGRGASPGPCGTCPFIRACNGNPATPFAWLACRVGMTGGPVET